jgi:hypothetical protein
MRIRIATTVLGVLSIGTTLGLATVVITRRTGVDHLSDLPATAAGFGLGRTNK